MTARITSGPAGAGASAPGACRHVLGLSAPGPGELAAARLADVLRENPRLPLHTLARSLGTAPRYPAHRGGFDRPPTAQPLVFAVEYATAGLLIDVGLRPAALLGYSIGECTAMCLAGVLDLPRAAAFVAARARAIEATAAAAPPGAMTAVVAGAEELTGLLGDDVVLAAVDGPHLCVLAGPADGLAKVEDRPDGAGIASRRLPVEFAFHSPAMAGAVATVREARAAGLRPRAFYVIPDFANPTGESLDLAARRGLLAIAQEHGLLLEDNPYGLFRASGSRLPTLKPWTRAPGGLSRLAREDRSARRTGGVRRRRPAGGQ
ncbi:acyltransferase domain-containing protein [Streptomyces sp. NPDC057496]|uniref:acyltransferase domain-containing protein n=1 Tax=Streptomyces sp. NPDC057496 TaxID=3346149 RepID=UPI0036943A6D